MKINIKIQRYNPETDNWPFFQTYEVETEPDARLLDTLVKIKQSQDSSLTFRKSCAHGICGSDAMHINGKDRLACKTLIRDVTTSEGDTVTIEPLRHMPVQRDLAVDQTDFFDKYKSVSPFLINNEPVKEKERIQSISDRKKFDEATNCILCSSCYSACPVLENKSEFLGPAAIVQAKRFLDDTRDKGNDIRMNLLDDENGVWSCENHFECTKACPRSIRITRLINQTKRKIEKQK